MKLLSPCGGLIQGFQRAAAMMRLRRRMDLEMARRVSGLFRDPGADAGSLTHLREGVTWSVGPHDGVVSLRVVRGSLWITESGSADDVLRRDGETFEATRCGKVVIQALSDSVIDIAMNAA
jgi:hypothetical protein